MVPEDAGKAPKSPQETYSKPSFCVSMLVFGSVRFQRCQTKKSSAVHLGGTGFFRQTTKIELQITLYTSTYMCLVMLHKMHMIWDSLVWSISFVFFAKGSRSSFKFTHLSGPIVVMSHDFIPNKRTSNPSKKKITPHISGKNEW